MTPNLVRVLLSLALLVLSVVMWLEVVVAVDQRSSTNTAFLVADIGTVAVITLGWLAIWRRAVSWTIGRVVWTCVAFGVAVTAAVLISLFEAVGRHNEELGLVVGALTWGAAWFGGTALAWRETSAERAARAVSGDSAGPVCLQCGYNMKGLREARCPECGRTYTLDELLAGQRPRDSLESR